MDFNVVTACNPVLAIGVRKVDVIMTVTATGAEEGSKTSAKKAVMFLMDNSGSMDEPSDPNRRSGPTRLQVALPAVIEGIKALDEDCMFGVVSFNSSASVVVHLCPATKSNKSNAINAVNRISAGGGTSMARGLMGVLSELGNLDGYIKYVQLITDGENGDGETDMGKALAQCESKFQCSCWGIGTQWKPTDLKRISDRLLGTAEAVPEISKLKDYFLSVLGNIMGKGSADIKLRLQSPKTSTLKSVKQVDPMITELTNLVKPFDDKQIDVPLGAWGNETRKYHLVFDIEPQPDGGQMMVCMPKIADGADVTNYQRVVVQWSSNDDLTAQIDPEVAHYTGQQVLAKSIADGMAAKNSGDLEQATILLGRAAKIAAETGNDEVTMRLKKVVDIEDAEQGTVRLKKSDKAADLELDMGGTITVKRRV